MIYNKLKLAFKKRKKVFRSLYSRLKYHFVDVNKKVEEKEPLIQIQEDIMEGLFKPLDLPELRAPERILTTDEILEVIGQYLTQSTQDTREFRRRLHARYPELLGPFQE